MAEKYMNKIEIEDSLYLDLEESKIDEDNEDDIYTEKSRLMNCQNSNIFEI